MRKILALLAFLLFQIAASAQNKTITGKVTDQNGAAIEGASIIIKGTRTGTAAATNGTFTISAKTGDVLEITAVNYAPREITIGDESNLTITLQQQVATINEVVVTALGIQRKRNRRADHFSATLDPQRRNRCQSYVVERRFTRKFSEGSPELQA